MPRDEEPDPLRSGPYESEAEDAPQPPDETTMVFLAGGDGALRAVYDAHSRLVFSFCRRALGPERAADVTQEVFTEVWRSRDRFDPARGTLRGWVMGIAKFKVLGTLRHDGARPVVPVDPIADDGRATGPTGAPGGGGGGDRDIDLVADRMTLAQALLVLPDRTRKAIHLAYVDGLSHREISEQLDLPLGSVKSDIRRGLARLRADLGSVS
jgi:RNA polymerase sigma factor (sigma-70 family)